MIQNQQQKQNKVLLSFLLNANLIPIQPMSGLKQIWLASKIFSVSLFHSLTKKKGGLGPILSLKNLSGAGSLGVC